MSNDVREHLAAYAHEAWSAWMYYLFQKGVFNPDGSFTIAPESAERWARQLGTPYRELPESEKASDRDEADKILAILNAEEPSLAAQRQIAQVFGVPAEVLTGKEATE